MLNNRTSANVNYMNRFEFDNMMNKKNTNQEVNFFETFDRLFKRKV